MITPQTILIHLKTFGVNLLLNKVTMVVIVRNQAADAITTPMIKKWSAPEGNAALDAPKNMDPSIIA